ncbi:hypothetical protein Cantr_06576 [Candida viswanathii]|uniref:Uncharacterized protein n=1 Tax=Candida viswanathii TaxID=5486 RepID=A0A367XWH4_9ASCO|nr:hypothetical protein Cantr_06576 [Candida viswanathii]
MSQPPAHPKIINSQRQRSRGRDPPGLQFHVGVASSPHFACLHFLAIGVWKDELKLNTSNYVVLVSLAAINFEEVC